MSRLVIWVVLAVAVVAAAVWLAGRAEPAPQQRIEQPVAING